MGARRDARAARAARVYLCYADCSPPTELHLGLGYALSVILWLTVLIYWLASLFYTLDGLQALLLPLAARRALLPRPVPRPACAAQYGLVRLQVAPAHRDARLQPVHHRLAARALMALVERRLHGGSAAPRARASSATAADHGGAAVPHHRRGLLLLTLTLVSGIVFSEEVFGRPRGSTQDRLRHPVVADLRRAARRALLYGWRGRIAVRWTLAGFLAAGARLHRQPVRARSAARSRLNAGAGRADRWPASQDDSWT